MSSAFPLSLGCQRAFSSSLPPSCVLTLSRPAARPISYFLAKTTEDPQSGAVLKEIRSLLLQKKKKQQKLFSSQQK